MKKLPPPNWEEIKTRYCVNGEKPSDIAKDYKVAEQTVHNRAYKEGWKYEQVEIGSQIRVAAIEQRQRITTLYLTEIEEVGIEVQAARRNGTIGMTVQDGEGFPNQFYKEAYKAGLNLVTAALKDDDEVAEAGGFEVSRESD